jgi:thymidine kinase
MEGFSETVDGLLKEVKELETQCNNCAWNIGRTLRLQEEWEAKQEKEGKSLVG